MTRKASSRFESMHPIAAAAATMEDQARSLMMLVAKTVPIEQVACGLRYNLYTRILQLALADCFYDVSDEEKANLSGVPPEKFKDLRLHAAYGKTVAHIEKVRKALEDGTTDKIAELYETAVAGETLLLALFDADTRNRLAAANELTGRRSAKKGREMKTLSAPAFPPEILEMMREARSIMAEKAKADADPKVH